MFVVQTVMKPAISGALFAIYGKTIFLIHSPWIPKGL